MRLRECFRSSGRPRTEQTHSVKWTSVTCRDVVDTHAFLLRPAVRLARRSGVVWSAVASERPLDARQVHADAAVLARLLLVPAAVEGEGAAGAAADGAGLGCGDAGVVVHRAPICLARPEILHDHGARGLSPHDEVRVVLALPEHTACIKMES